MLTRSLNAAAVLGIATAFLSSTAHAQSCTSTTTSASAEDAKSTSAAEATSPEVQKAADYVLEKAEGGLRVMVAGGYYSFETASGEVLTAETISNATGTELTDQDMRAVLDLVSAGAGQGASSKTSEAAGQSACSTDNLCSDLGACSFYGDLATAQGETRAKYLAEKSQDGRTYEDFDLPLFEARTVSGDTVSSASLEGQPALVALLAPHCGHSIRSLATLKRLDRRYRPKGVHVVGVFVNTSTIASAKSRADQYEITYPLWTYESDDLGTLLETHLAPTTLLVDAKGKVRVKFVGEKTERELIKALDALLEDGGVELGMAR